MDVNNFMKYLRKEYINQFKREVNYLKIIDYFLLIRICILEKLKINEKTFLKLN